MAYFFQLNFDAPVIEITRVAVHSKIGGCLLDEPAEADALHAAVDNIAFGDIHKLP